MRSPHEVTGFPAAEGVFFGPVVWLDDQIAAEREAGAPEDEIADFRLAVSAAVRELEALHSRHAGPARKLVEVQLEWLRDAELIGPVEAKIRAGESATGAWSTEISGHASAVDPSVLPDISDIERRVLRHLLKSEPGAAPRGAVLAGNDITPTQFLEADWSGGGAVLLERGSVSSHAAILARGRGVPMIVGAGPISREHRSALVDGRSGLCVLDPMPDQLSTPTNMRHRSESDLEGRRVLADAVGVQILLNINSLDELTIAAVAECDGIGLVRSEFLFRDTGTPPDEDSQCQAYGTILQWAKGKPVAVRLFDLGGDKPSFGLAVSTSLSQVDGRGMAALLRNRDVLKPQLRALLRAAPRGDLRILLPMITDAAQLFEAKVLLAQCAKEVDYLVSGRALPLVGIMVEVPETARHPELFEEADFFALGTNDLTQFITGRSREAAGGHQLSASARRALLDMVSRVADYGARQHKAVSICGEMAADLDSVEDLVRLGARALSVPPAKAAQFMRLRQPE